MSKYNIYAFSDEASPDTSEQIKAMKRNALTGSEVRGVNGKNVSSLTVSEAKEFRKQLDCAGLKAGSIGSPVGKIKITDTFAPHLDVLRRVLETGSILGAEKIRIFSFYIPEGENPSLYRDEVIERMGKITEICKDASILPCHENEKDIYGDTPERCLDLLENIPGLCCIYDPANFVQCGVDTEKAFEILRSRITYLHIKDALYDGTVVPAGKGDGNLLKTVSGYIADGGKDFTLEPHLTVFEGLSEIEKGGHTSVTGKYIFKDSNEAFDCACDTFKKMLHGIEEKKL